MRRAAALLLACMPLACDALLGADFDDLPHPPGATAQGSGGSIGEGGGPPQGGAGGGGLGEALPLVCGDMAGLQAGAPWPMEGYCPTRQGRSPALGFTKPKIRWVAALSEQIHTEPIVAADGTVFVVTMDVLTMTTPRLHAVKDGTAVWFHEVSALSAPAIGADGTIYFANAVALTALDQDGNELWTHPVGSGVRGSPAIGADGTIYITTNGGVRAVTATGEEAWTASQVTQPLTSVAIGLDGTLYVGTVSGVVYALDPDGQTKWTFATSDLSRDTPVVGGADVIYLKNDKRVYAVDAAGHEKWSFSTGKWPTIMPSAFGETLFTVAIEDNNSFTLWALDAQGQPDWSVADLGNTGRFALSADGLLVSFTAYRPMAFDPEVLARRPDGGAVSWNLAREQGSVMSWPGTAFGADGVIYAAVIDELIAVESE
jgi:hypothetical protein